MRVLYLSALIVLVDQATKLAVKGIEFPLLGLSFRGMPYGASKPILGTFLRFTYIENPGMAFGIDPGAKLFFSIFSLAAGFLIFFYLWYARDERIGFRLGLALILGGAMGNLIDRVFYGVLFHDAPLFYGRVVDFLDVDFFDFNGLGIHITRWPVFNIADAAVCVGIVVLFLFHKPKRPRESVSLAAPDPGPPSVSAERPEAGTPHS